MSCYFCSKSFNVFRREKGCPSCGFSFCSSCLDNNMFVAKLNKIANVCDKCKAKGDKSEPDVVVPPDALSKRLKEAEIKSKATIIHNMKDDDYLPCKSQADKQIADRLLKLSDRKMELISKSTIDTELEERLMRLRQVDSNIPTGEAAEAQIKARLARLTETTENLSQQTNTKKSLPSLDMRSDEEKARDLIKQYLNEVELDCGLKKDYDASINEIGNRLKALQGNCSNVNFDEGTSKELDDEQLIKNIIEKLKVEADLENVASEIIDLNTTSHKKEFEELPWCEICNEDAHVRCTNCRYLFCMRCFNEHKDDECYAYVIFKKNI